MLIEPIEPPNEVNKIMMETILPTLLSENLERYLELSIGYNGAVKIPTIGKRNISILTFTSVSCPIIYADDVSIMPEIRQKKNIFIGENFTTALLASNLPIKENRAKNAEDCRAKKESALSVCL